MRKTNFPRNRSIGRRLLTGALFICLCSFAVRPGIMPVREPQAVTTSGITGLNLPQRLASFNPLQPEAEYSISLCADIPDNDRPDKVYVKKETGHVFLILQKSIPGKAIAQVFGFYPVRPVSSILFKNVRCEILDNGKREYNASVTKKLSATEFAALLQKAKALTNRKYNINRFNCYDYAVEVFNSLPGIEKLPVTHVKFPFIFGRGGSPCGLYRDLEKLKAAGSVWAPAIQFGVFKAPASFQES